MADEGCQEVYGSYRVAQSSYQMMAELALPSQGEAVVAVAGESFQAERPLEDNETLHFAESTHPSQGVVSCLAEPYQEVALRWVEVVEVVEVEEADP